MFLIFFPTQMLLAVKAGTVENSRVGSLLFVGSEPADAVTVKTPEHSD